MGKASLAALQMSEMSILSKVTSYFSSPITGLDLEQFARIWLDREKSHQGAAYGRPLVDHQIDNGALLGSHGGDLACGGIAKDIQ